MSKPSILVLCTGNSCRSHMGEGILRAVLDHRNTIYSAGSKPVGFVHPMAIRVMQEIGIDISTHCSKNMSDFLDREINTVITVCGDASCACPTFPGQKNLYHWGFDDPAHTIGNEEAVHAAFCRVRDQIKLVFDAYAAGLIEDDAR